MDKKDKKQYCRKQYRRECAFSQKRACQASASSHFSQSVISRHLCFIFRGLIDVHTSRFHTIYDIKITKSSNLPLNVHIGQSKNEDTVRNGDFRVYQGPTIRGLHQYLFDSNLTIKPDESDMCSPFSQFGKSVSDIHCPYSPFR